VTPRPYALPRGSSQRNLGTSRLQATGTAWAGWAQDVGGASRWGHLSVWATARCVCVVIHLFVFVSGASLFKL
jgi:hypothetical protein